MSLSADRRQFLTAAASGAWAITQGFPFFGQLPPVSAAESKLDPNIVQLQPEIEPLVRLLEDTPRAQLLEEIGARVRRGLSYREVLAALLLAGVRNVQPRPAVGFKFHAVLVVNSAHLASLSSPDRDRWLPVFWALDYFKSSQERDVQEGNWTMAPVDEAAVPPAHKACDAFIDAMETWDEQSADVAVAGMVRSAGANELFELFARFGARDFRSIGHKAIFVANSWRTLQCIGWQHAEPVLRSLAYALLNHQGEANPANADLEPDRPWRRNLGLAQNIRDEWQTGQPSSEATTELLETLRGSSPDEACDHVVKLLNDGIAPRSIFDALLVGAGELLMRQPGIIGLHSVTTTNALHYAYRTSGNDETRRLLMLQNAAFLPMFRQAMHNRGKVGDARIDLLQPAELSSDEPVIENIFRDISGQQTEAARKVLAFARDPASAKQLIDTARQFIFLKGTDAHDYKFSSAALEDFYAISPDWRSRFLATSVFNLHGSGDPDNPLVERIRQSLQA